MHIRSTYAKSFGSENRGISIFGPLHWISTRPLSGGVGVGADVTGGDLAGGVCALGLWAMVGLLGALAAGDDIVMVAGGWCGWSGWWWLVEGGDCVGW